MATPVQTHIMRRRSLLRAGVALPLAVLAGCTGSPDGSSTPSPPDGPASNGATGAPNDGTPTDAGDETASPTPTVGPTGTPTGTPSLDLREANVTGVSVSGTEETVEFDVTLYHDDDGEEGYANWWQVERLDGTRLGRRDLLHAHGTREFTRSAAVEVPGDVTCVVVRGHDQTHGYGGRAALVNLESGATRVVEQGPEPRSFAASDCP
jgi:hypothetical protein